jgi:uncharacterized protein (TIGR00106 family)
MLVEFSIVPMGEGASVSRQVAQVIAIVEQSGLPYRLNPMGTVVEGAWDEVMSLIRSCHETIMAEGERVITTLKIDDRKGHSGMLEQKIASVEKRLGHKPRA